MDLDELAAIVAPEQTAIITQECQLGVIGPKAALPQLAEAARDTGMIDNVARLVEAGRAAGVQIIHHVATHRPDLKGANHNARLFRAMARRGGPQVTGSEMTEIAPPITVDESDIMSSRLHGLGPLAGTDVDPILRNLGTKTLVVVGVSSNVAIPNTVFDAVNLAYEVVLPRDAVAGVPTDYTDTIIANSLSLVATITTTDELVACWTR
ncbi:MAG TPA: cysteine hydrolase [Acidimicrobiia bacterium]|nr:cysteine hydrolase [Acidimicrobiia bacterium]